MTLRFSGIWPWWLVLAIAALGAFLIARWYSRESNYLSTSSRWLLPWLRATAFFFILMMLAGPTLYHERIQGELSHILVLLDTSSSMGTVDSSKPDRSRLESALDWLIGGGQEKDDAGWLNELQRHHRIQLALSNQTTEGKLHWDSSVSATLPPKGSIQPSGVSSPLGEFLEESISSKLASKSPSQSKAYAAAIFVSDGQSNSGKSMQESVTRYVEEQLPVYAVAVGSAREPEDLGIVQVEHSQQVYATDRMRGSITVKERIQAGTPYRVAIQQHGTQIYSKTIVSLDQGLRRIDFELPASLLVERAKNITNSDIQLSAYPIDLDFHIDCKSDEVSQINNDFATSLWGVQRKNRVLILDRQGGWEIRYIKNAFERDVVWDTQASIGRTSFSGSAFPATRADLFDCDLVIASFDTLRSLSSEQLNWVSEFVATTGGGLIVCDNKREQPDSPMDTKLAALLPVRFKKIVAVREDSACSVTPTSKDQPALQLGSDSKTNDSVWSHLPPPKSMRSVGLVAGAETMVEITPGDQNQDRSPLLVTKLFGQGRVVYFASDETWRWRYDVADLHHQRFWNQLATWTMRTPFAVSNSFASLDSGSRVYTPKESILIRAMLKRDDLRPLLDASARVAVHRKGQPTITLPLDQEAEARGFYRTTLDPLPEGSYRVSLEVNGIPASALELETQFMVQPPPDVEMLTLACNEVALRQLGAATGGGSFKLDEVDSLSEKLERFRTGSIVESQTNLWQSFPWFAVIVCLLSAEWYLRKREGLV